MTKVKAVLFDLDGVIFDTEHQYSVFWGEQCRLFHPNDPGLEQRIKGQTLNQIYEQILSGSLKPMRPVVTERPNAFEAAMTFDYVPGFMDFLRMLHKDGIKTAVVTSSNREKMKAVYKQHPDFTQLFDIILTSDDFTGSKPDPSCYLTAARQLNVTPDACIVFEDSFNGLRAGKAAEMRVVGLSTTNPATAIAPLCDVVISDYHELEKIDFLLK
ncbi:MAG: HAD family phosphatase [Prevotella sp.]|nr:HAD family phosphatase [Prevotella sp.]